jgi:hypothetical protein
MEKKLLIGSVLFALGQMSLQSVYAIDDIDRAAASAVCYSALTGNNNHSIIMIPLLSQFDDLDSRCHIDINSGWHAGGIAKGRYYTQDCSDITNQYYGGGYTSYVTEAYFEANRSLYPSCNSSNAFICCSPSFPN